MHYENVLQPSLHGHFIIEVNISWGQFIHLFMCLICMTFITSC